MSPKTCPDWPLLLEQAPDLVFRHYTIAEARLPADALVQIEDVSLADFAVCCDREHNVFYAAHTVPEVARALVGTHWFDLGEWVGRRRAS